MPTTRGSHTEKWTRFARGGMATEGEWLLRSHIKPAPPPTLAQFMGFCGEPFRFCSKRTDSEITTVKEQQILVRSGGLKKKVHTVVDAKIQPSYSEPIRNNAAF